MATILNIETSTSVCSVALTSESMVLHHYEDYTGHNHAALLSGFIKGCLDFAREKQLRIDAVSVSQGPGSYTGLRIGLSEAKGLCYGLGVPLIGIETLKILAVAVMFSRDDLDPECVFVPMLDARRMEVYTAAYDMALSTLLEPQPMVLGDDSYEQLFATGRQVVMMGDGVQKASQLFEGKALIVPGVAPLAVDMMALSDLAYSRGEFIDVAYSTPLYLKDFQATTPKHKVI